MWLEKTNRGLTAGKREPNLPCTQEMAFSRYGRDSDVYVYADTRGGYTCERCPKVGESFRCATATEMVNHLVSEHRAKGHRVPEDALEELRAEKGD